MRNWVIPTALSLETLRGILFGGPLPLRTHIIEVGANCETPIIVVSNYDNEGNLEERFDVEPGEEFTTTHIVPTKEDVGHFEATLACGDGLTGGASLGSFEEGYHSDEFLLDLEY